MVQILYNSTSTMGHITITKLEKFFEALGMVSIVKLSKETRAFYEC